MSLLHPLPLGLERTAVQPLFLVSERIRNGYPFPPADPGPALTREREHAGVQGENDHG